MILSVSKAVIGADIALFKGSSYGSSNALEEAKIAEFLTKNKIENGGLVTNYGFIPQSLNVILSD